MSTKKPSLPAVPNDVSPSTKTFLQAVKETVEVFDGKRGDNLDRAVTFRDLIDSGLAQVKVSSSGIKDPAAEIEGTVSIDYSIPASITGLNAVGAFTSVILSWDQVAYKNLSHVEIWRSTTDDIGTATIAGSASSNVFMDYVGTSDNYFYWVKPVSTSNVPGSFNATAGTEAHTEDDAAYLMGILSGDPDSQLAMVGQDDLPFVFKGGKVYLNAVAIKDASILNAKIQNIAAEKISAGIVNVALTLNAADINGGSLNINNRFTVDSQGNTTIRSGTTGARLELVNNVIRVYDAGNVLRVKIGNLA